MWRMNGLNGVVGGWNIGPGLDPAGTNENGWRAKEIDIDVICVALLCCLGEVVGTVNLNSDVGWLDG